MPLQIEHPLQEHLMEPQTATIGACADLFVEAQAAIVAADVIDSGAARIPGYPYLRVNRFLSSFRNEISGEQFEVWVNQLQELAIQGWQYEIANLPDTARHCLQPMHASDLSITAPVFLSS